ncbi:hypothetical protein HGRIS_006534 [Hohenbuehelia grisea]|uniref:Uncharacterized protein n=1 Tax=Hohenbuehelia grisea TaxID=104357 RepID=A0ABR3J9A7_9AGAR
MMAGQHALIIHFTMEGCVIGMPRTDYDEITNSHVKTRGNKNDAWHRSFEIPRRLFKPNSSPTEFRTLNIYAAFVSKDWVWALTDHQRLMHIRVACRENVWTQADLSPDSPSWDGQLFKGLNSPYDWIHERAEAEKALDRWRDSCRRSCGGSRTWGSTIIKSLADNNHKQAGSFGRHCINDTCYLGAVYPGTPESFIATNRETYTRLKTAMGAFADLIAHNDYKKKVCITSNSTNPFAFNPDSNRAYFRKYVFVMRRTSVLMPRDLFELYASLGYFDREHTLGERYPPGKRPTWLAAASMTEKTSAVWVPVYLRYDHGEKADTHFWTPIVAKAPKGWAGRNIDKTRFMFKTTLGPYQFRPFILNQIFLGHMRGRPTIGRTTRALIKADNLDHVRSPWNLVEKELSHVEKTKADCKTVKKRRAVRDPVANLVQEKYKFKFTAEIVRLSKDSLDLLLEKVNGEGDEVDLLASEVMCQDLADILDGPAHEDSHHPSLPNVLDSVPQEEEAVNSPASSSSHTKEAAARPAKRRRMENPTALAPGVSGITAAGVIMVKKKICPSDPNIRLPPGWKPPGPQKKLVLNCRR